MGKKIGDSHTETSFAKKDLPKETRVMGEGDMATMDHKPDRYVCPFDKNTLHHSEECVVVLG